MSNTQTRTVFFISDSTGISAQTLGHTLLAQFEHINFRQITYSFIDSVEKAQQCLPKIIEAKNRDSHRPVIFSTLLDEDIQKVFHDVDALFIEFIDPFIDELEREFDQEPTHRVGKLRGAVDQKRYNDRIEAINFSLDHDDGVTDRNLDKADVILIGVSRSGKTPTSLYLALQFGIRAANYPLIPEDFDRNALPASLASYKNKLIGLTIAPERLHQIREERRPGSKYASLENCKQELAAAEKMMKREGIKVLNSSTRSIEELAASIIGEFGLEKTSF